MREIVNNQSHFLDGNLFYLRKIERSDINDNYYSWLNNSNTTKYMEIRKFPNSFYDMEKYIERSAEDNSEIMFAICLKDNCKHIGNVKLWSIDWVNRNAMISIMIGDYEYVGLGIASESIRVICEYVFDVLNMHKLMASVHEDNVASLRAFEKNGFVQEGLFLNQLYFEGKWSSQVWLGKVANQ